MPGNSLRFAVENILLSPELRKFTVYGGQNSAERGLYDKMPFWMTEPTNESIRHKRCRLIAFKDANNYGARTFT